MDLKDFLYNEDFSNVKKAFLYYHATFKPSGITALKKGKYQKKGYVERIFKSDAKECLKLKSPELTL